MFCMFCIRIQDPESPYKDNSLYHSSHATYRHVLWIWSKPGGKPIKLSVLCRLIKTNQSQRKKNVCMQQSMLTKLTSTTMLFE